MTYLQDTIRLDYRTLLAIGAYVLFQVVKEAFGSLEA